MTDLWLDLETFSDVPITHGTHAYAERAEIMLFAWALDDGPVSVWDLTTGAPMPDLLAEALGDPAVTLWAHNSHFDRTVLRHAMPDAPLPIPRWRDTMVQALAHGLPGSLGDLCGILNVPTDKAKDKDGRSLIHLFCKPRPKTSKLRRATRETHPAEWARFVRYAGLDIEAMRAIRAKLPEWNYKASAPVLRNDTGDELGLWHLDQEINDRGVAVDLDLARSAIRAVDRAQKGLAARTVDLTDGAVQAATQRDALLRHLLAEYGVDLPDLQKSTLERRLADPDLPPELRELLAIRLQASSTSVAKYKTLMKGVSSDGRLRGTLQFNGASRTGRWAGRLFQPQNLSRPTLKQAAIEDGIEAMKADVEDLLTENVTELASSAIRGCLVAPPGKKLVVADLSNIEGRMAAWLAGEDWKLRAFAEFDAGHGADLYKRAYAAAFGIDPADVDKLQRQIGKVMELMLQYEGGVGAFLTGAATYRIDLDAMTEAAWPSLPPDVRAEAGQFLAWRQTKRMGNFGLADRTFIACDSLKRLWRRAHPAISSYWKDLENAARLAVQRPGVTVECRRLAFRRDGAWLRMRLPSGRFVCYPGSRVEDSGKLSYMGINQYSRKWQRLKTYGGKLCIAAGTLVLTARGWIVIEQVRADDEVWDGYAWVRTEGALRKGRSAVIYAHGAWMTPDHEILTAGGWRRASQSERYHRVACRLPDGVAVPRIEREKVDLGGALRLRERSVYRRDGISEAGEARHPGVVRVPAGRYYQPEAHQARHVHASGVRGLAVHGGPVHAAVPPSVAQLRCAWDQGLRTLAGVFRRLLDGHGAFVPAWAVSGPDQQRRRLLAAELPVDDARRTGPEPPRQPHRGDALRPHDAGGPRQEDGDLPLDDLLPDGPRGFPGAVGRAPRYVAEVFDLINCGPRHRFVVATPDGPLIVHNCENATQAASRDVLAESMPAIETAGYRIVLSVHDELITEAPDDPAFNPDQLAALMATNPPWAEGLPLAAAGFEAKRYRKD